MVRELCSSSGALPNRLCPDRIQGRVIHQVSSVDLCRVHQSDGGRVREVWPTSVSAWLVSSGMRRSEKLQDDSPDSAPQILRPHPGDTYRLRTQPERGRQDLELVAVSDTPGTPLYWFVNGRAIGVSKSGEPI